ncbi:MAG: tetratricopeptide repeat protein [Gemmataceae bacterium]
MKWYSAIILTFFAVGTAAAGVHYSTEQIAQLPSQWRGYLLDQRALRLLALPTSANNPATPFRLAYEAERDRLEKLAAKQSLTADEMADLGALHIRLGQPERAVELLRAALRTSPSHFATAANLGTACQLTGDLPQAIATLEVAVDLAPSRWKAAERLHLKLVRARSRDAKQATALDSLFDADAKPSPETVAALQALGLWLPADGRVLWQLGEIAHATGDTVTAASILDGCVSDFGMNDPLLREHRATYRAAAPAPAGNMAVAKAAHETHQSMFKSIRPLIRQKNVVKLPEIRTNGVNMLPWDLLSDTTLEQPFRPTFPEHLRKLAGKRVTLNGFMQPTGGGLAQTDVLLIEFQVGCWFCNSPEPTGIVRVEMPKGKMIQLTRDAVRVEGVLTLNSADPEDYLYTITEAKVGPPE